MLVLLAVLAGGTFLAKAVAPGLVRRRLISAVHDNCGTCELSLDRVSVSLRPPALDCSRVRFTGGEPNATVINVEAERVHLPFSVLPLLNGRLRAGRIVIERPEVKVTEGDLYASSSAKGGAARGPDLEIAGIEVKNGSFLYIREHAGRKGGLSVSGINAALGPVGSSGSIRNEYAEANAAGLLERSGKFRLQVRARIFAEAPDANVKLEIAGQDLSALNVFFGPNDAILLHGALLEGRSSVAIRGERLNSSAYVRYRGLRVQIKKNDERGALAAFFQNLMASITMGRQNAEGNYDRRGMADLERKPKETLVSFTLRGMKEAAMQVSTRGRK